MAARCRSRAPPWACILEGEAGTGSRTGPLHGLLNQVDGVCSASTNCSDATGEHPNWAVEAKSMTDAEAGPAVPYSSTKPTGKWNLMERRRITSIPSKGDLMRNRTMLVRAVIATALAVGGPIVISAIPAQAARMPISATCPTCAPATTQVGSSALPALSIVDAGPNRPR